VAERDVFGAVLISVGALLIAFHRPLGVLQVRSQPRWMHPWKNAVTGSRAVILIIGIGVLVSGVLEIVDVVGWLTGTAR
jgi:hypothetical protein